MPLASSLPEYRACPNCAEPILVEASVCKHCHQTVPPFSKPELQEPKKKHRYWKAVGGTLFALVAWIVYYWATWTPSAPTTKTELERSVGTAQLQELGETPKSLAKTFVENIGKETIAAREVNMLIHLRTFATAESIYKLSNGKFAPSLEVLSQADQLNSELARVAGYTFSYQLGASGSDYRLSARPSVYSQTAIASCITNGTEIHCTNEDREATYSDPIRE